MFGRYLLWRRASNLANWEDGGLFAGFFEGRLLVFSWADPSGSAMQLKFLYCYDDQESCESEDAR